MSMFEHLKSREVAGKTVELHVPQIAPEAYLVVSPATESNHGYYNAFLKRAGARQRPVAGRAKVSEADAARDDDRALYADYVLQGWRGILDQDGKEVPFSREAARELCQVLPAWIFDRVRLFCIVPENFLTEPLPKADELAGN